MIFFIFGTHQNSNFGGYQKAILPRKNRHIAQVRIGGYSPQCHQATPQSLESVAEAADAIFRGYAFSCEGPHVRVLNLNAPTHAAFMRRNGKILETSMDDIEIQLMLSNWSRVSKYVEE